MGKDSDRLTCFGFSSNQVRRSAAAATHRRLLEVACLVTLLAPTPAAPRKFYDDDPLWRMPPPMDTGKLAQRKLSDVYDFMYMSFAKPGEKAESGTIVLAGATNTLGEVPDSHWYTNRHGRRRMSIEELVRGPGNSNPPSMDRPWKITSVKSEGVTPGFNIEDSNGRKYQIKFDAKANFELPTGADVLGSKFFYALGYFTPENYIVYFNREQLVVKPGTKWIDRRGVKRDLKQSDITRILEDLPCAPGGRFRAVASLYLAGKPLGPFRYHGLRTDDPNDIVPHEHRRDLRGLRVFAAWLNHTDTKSLNSLDMLVQDGGVSVIRHHLLDFSAAFGTDAFGPKSPRAGNVFMVDWPDMTKTFFSMGLYVPAWARADFKHVRAVGRIESDVFDPRTWKSHYYNPAFANCLPDDAFWAAKQVMVFTEPEIRALVSTAQYSDPEGAEYLIKVLIERQRKIGQWAFTHVLPLDNFRVESGRLTFDDLAIKHGFSRKPSYTVSWATFDNDSERLTPIVGASSLELPESECPYITALLDGGDPSLNVRVYVRERQEVVGVERRWKRIVEPSGSSATRARQR
jgi:hypothetical protein